MSTLADLLNLFLFLVAVPFIVVAVGLLYIAYLLAGNPRHSTFTEWLRTAAKME